MACDTFIKIAQKCRRHFVMQQSGETEPFIDEILRTLPRITIDLSPHQVHTFYEAVGYMIAAQPNKPTQERLIAKLMELPNTAWDSLMQQAHNNVDVFGNSDNIKILSNILKTNVSACTSIGSYFLPQIGRIYLDMLALYRSVSGLISAKVEAEGLIATKTPVVRGLRTIKKDILRLVETYVKRAEDLNAVNENLIPSLLDAILGDYHNNVAPARDAEVLNVMATITTRLGGLLTDKVSPIMDAVFSPTLSMISSDFAEYPEHRVGFFRLLRAINVHCFSAILSLPPEKFKLCIDAGVWAIKHTMRDIADTGLQIMLELITNVSNQDQSVASGFYQQYLLSIIQDTFYVLCEPDHKAGFKTQCAVLAKIYELIETGKVQVPLGPDSSVDNRTFIRQYTSSLLKNAFPQMSPAYVDEFTNGLCQHSSDLSAYKLHLRDFLIASREAGGTAGEDNNADLFVEDKEAERAAQAAKEKEQAAKIPGMLKPTEMKDEDEEL